MTNISKLRQELSKKFDDVELDAFCLDNFPDVFNRFSRGLLKDEKITLLLDHCNRKGKLDLLLNLLNTAEKNNEMPLLSHPQQTSISSFTVLKLHLRMKDNSKMEVRGLDVPSGSTPRSVVNLPYSIEQLKAILKALEIGSLDIQHFRPKYIQALSGLGLLTGGRLHANFYQFIGYTLYQALFSGEILIELKIAQNRHRPIACQLCFDPEDVMLAQFPWELIHDKNMHLIIGKGGISMARSLTYSDPPSPLRISLPIRLLYIRPRPIDDTELPFDEEKDAILIGLDPLHQQGQLIWKELIPPTWDAFEECLSSNTFDVIHFDGHGMFARVCPNCRIPHYPSIEKCVSCKADMKDVQPGGYLHFEDLNHKTDRISVADMKVVVANRSTQLVVLSACASGTTQGISVFNGIAPGLIQAGIPAVVGVQGSPSTRAMAKFVERMYAGLADFQPLPEAVNRGRLAIYRTKPPAWFMPVVYLRSSDTTCGQLFTK